MAKKRTPKHSRPDRTIESVEALLAFDRMQNEASYRMRGRHLEPLTDAGLKRPWIKWLRRDLLHRKEIQDFCCEFSMRGIVQVDLPPDLIESMVADRKNIRPHGGESGLN